MCFDSSKEKREMGSWPSDDDDGAVTLDEALIMLTEMKRTLEKLDARVAVLEERVRIQAAAHRANTPPVVLNEVNY